ncbi:hypothetical protein AAFF_G00035510 [Aldrovandia affinis]|uniref:Uncharacterized protein n=1 Tax=Aldrovandia affinis TaxID=143900 RepID=A0AAD7S321_9TELE|nr:hypothetical protein AAFF_G00035510 [Aldrovandia affinis]
MWDRLATPSTRRSPERGKAFRHREHRATVPATQQPIEERSAALAPFCPLCCQDPTTLSRVSQGKSFNNLTERWDL